MPQRPSRQRLSSNAVALTDPINPGRSPSLESESRDAFPALRLANSRLAVFRFPIPCRGRSERFLLAGVNRQVLVAGVAIRCPLFADP